MGNTEFVYTIYISSTPEKVWEAITKPEVTRQYWMHENISGWQKGSKWQHVSSDEKRVVRVIGEVLESAPPRRLVLTWAGPADTAKPSRVTYEIETVDDMVRLTVSHTELKSGSEMAGRVAIGWPRVLSSMKSLLETGKPLNTWAGHG